MVVRIPIPAPLTSGSLVETCVAYYYSNHLVKNTANMLRFINRLIVTLTNKKFSECTLSSRARMWCTCYPLSYALVVRK